MKHRQTNNVSIRKREVTQPQQHTEYNLFNSQGNLKAYSDDVMSFAYYGYNAANTRTYKISLYNTNLWINGQQQPLNMQLQNAMFYPNTYLNFNQNGEYTKHYYNGTERVASRLGDNTTTIALNNNILEDRKLSLEERVRNEIQELISDPTQVDLPPMLDILNLQPTGTPNDIYYYHPNHLGNTAFVTDQNQNITQGFLYAPFGEITTEYNINFGNNTIPKYSFNAKELDEETGMYYYEARYYNPPTFTSRDPLFEKYPTFSPYTYCMNNPIKYVDPDGRKIVIVINSQNGSSQQKLYYKRGDLYTDKGCRIYYMDNNSFALGVQSDLKKISSYGGKLASRLNSLENSPRTHEIKADESNHTSTPPGLLEGEKAGTTVFYKRNSENIRESISSLVHELLGHAYSADQGTIIKNQNTIVGKSTQEQINAIDIQNVYNKASNLDLRRTDKSKDKNGEIQEYDLSKYLNLEAENQ